MKPNSPLVFRLQAELNERLEKCAKELKQKKYSLALAAIEAVVEAIEKNDYQLALPIKFQVKNVVVPANRKSEDVGERDNPGSSHSHSQEVAFADEKPPPYKTKKRKAA